MSSSVDASVSAAASLWDCYSFASRSSRFAVILLRMKRWLILVAGVVLGLLSTSCGAGSSDESAGQDLRLVPWGFTAPASSDPETLHIAVSTAACGIVSKGALDHVEVHDSRSRLVVAAYISVPAEDSEDECRVPGATSIATEVNLDEPIGGRKIVDKACQKSTYRDHPDCDRTSGRTS